MNNFDNGKLASLIAVFYVLFFFGGIFVHFFISGEVYTLKYSLSLLRTWLAAIGGLLIAWGLWRHYRWSWWLGLVAVIYQLYGISPKIVKYWPFENFSLSTAIGINVIFILFSIFLVLLILPSTRKVCSK